MGWFTGVVVYFMIWWVTLFAVLPLWVMPTDPDEPGHAAGAPRQPHLLRKALVTTAIATVIWLAVFLLVRSPYLSFHDN